ncbi:hypothetical protein FGO68_gene15845 [Halteria grandinella]|uniref:Uncharacterized protein n=1 Tax=Halteria grandinella TaxID=5974 RepID=A0A8J8T7L6_HALGN|nr:hypothetical protein FGO68_gene15845 [Halteria grandinella]
MQLNQSAGDATLHKSQPNASSMVDIEASGIFSQLTSKKNKTKVVKAITRTSRESNKWMRNLKHFWLSQDLFGKRVEFTFKGQLEYHTAIGALMSVIIKLIMCLFIIYEFYIIFARKHPAVSVKHSIRSTKEKSLNPIDYGIIFAFSLTLRQDLLSTLPIQSLNLSQGHRSPTYDQKYYYLMDTLPAQFGKFSATFDEVQQNDKTGLYDFKQETLIVRKCTDADFPGFKEVQYHSCVDSSQIYLTSGNPLTSKEFSSINLQLEKCTNVSSTLICRSQEEIDALFGIVDMQIVYKNNMFDFKNFENPWANFIDEPILLHKDEQNMAEILIQSSTTELYDHYFEYWIQDKLQSAIVSNVERRAINFSQQKVVAQVRIRMDQREVTYGRVADTIFSALEQIGGFMESLMHLGLLLVFFFQERLFKSAFIRQLYQVSTEHDDGNFNEGDLLSMVQNKKKLGQSLIRQIIEFLLQKRTRFEYGYSLLCEYLSKCICLKSKGKLKEYSNQKHFLYEKGNEKLMMELDVLNLVRSLRQLRLMAQVMMPAKNRLLLKFQRKHVIEVTSSSSDSDQYDYDPVKLLKSKNGLLKVRQIAKMSKILEGNEEDNMTKVDKNLVKGLFRRRSTKKQQEIDQTKHSQMTFISQSNLGGISQFLRKTKLSRHEGASSSSFTVMNKQLHPDLSSPDPPKIKRPSKFRTNLLEPSQQKSDITDDANTFPQQSQQSIVFPKRKGGLKKGDQNPNLLLEQAFNQSPGKGGQSRFKGLTPVIDVQQNMRIRFQQQYNDDESEQSEQKLSEIVKQGGKKSKLQKDKRQRNTSPIVPSGQTVTRELIKLKLPNNQDEVGEDETLDGGRITPHRLQQPSIDSSVKIEKQQPERVSKFANEKRRKRAHKSNPRAESKEENEYKIRDLYNQDRPSSSEKVERGEANSVIFSTDHHQNSSRPERILNQNPRIQALRKFHQMLNESSTVVHADSGDINSTLQGNRGSDKNSKREEQEQHKK